MLSPEVQKLYASKCATPDEVFRRIRSGRKIFIGTGCGEPRYLVHLIVAYAENHPKAFFDASVFQVFPAKSVAGLEGLGPNFKMDSFFVGGNTRALVDAGLTDYTPTFLYRVPDFIRRGYVPVDVALIQTSPPDEEGRLSLGVSVDIVRAAVEKAAIVVAQVNSNMPFVGGDTLISLADVDFIVPYDEPILEYGEILRGEEVSAEVLRKIGEQVAKLVRDGDTLQVGYGRLPNAVLSHLKNKHNLGVHTELLTDGLVDLIRAGAVDNSKKIFDPGKTVAAYCMGRKDTYEFIHRNPAIELRAIDYTNNPVLVARQDRMVAINTVLEIDLTGQATSEDVRGRRYSGIDGQVDFIRGTALSVNGRTIIVIPSTSKGGTVSRIVPLFKGGVGATLNRADIHYVVTEFGTASLEGKNIRERALEMITIAHPRFRQRLIRRAINLKLVSEEHSFEEEKIGEEYPQELEALRTTKTGFRIFLRPVKISDESLVRDFFYSLSEQSLYLRFASVRKDMPLTRLKEFLSVDYSQDMLILAVVKEGENEKIVGLGQYSTKRDSDYAEISVTVRDKFQNRGIGTELVAYLKCLARKRGLSGFQAEVLMRNVNMLWVFKKMGFQVVDCVDGITLLKQEFPDEG